MEAEAETLIEHIWSVVQCYQVFEVEPTWIQSAIATWVATINNITKMLCAEIYIVDNVVFMGKVNNRSKIYMFTIFYISQANVVYMGFVSFHYNYDTALVKASGSSLSLCQIYTIVTSSFNITNI